MTVQEMKKRLEALHYRILHNVFCNKVHNAELEALNIANECIEEVEQYRALGTVEELKEAREKQIPKKPIVKEVVFEDEDIGSICVCPVCEGEIGLFEGQPYCEICGQKIDWEEGAQNEL